MMTTPTWRLTILKPIHLHEDTADAYVLEGDGHPPVATLLGPPPLPPVIVLPPDDETDEPFVFPTDGPQYGCRDFDRFYALDRTGTPGADYYSVEPDAGKPASSHRNAGIIAADGRTAYGRSIGGLRLWVRVVPGEDPLTGVPLPAASGRLIRRGLKLGHL